MMCKVFKTGKSSYYSWLKIGPSKRWAASEDLLLRINNIFEYSSKTYGSPRIKEELRAQGIQVSRPRVARIMKAAGIRARKPRRFVVTTDSRHNYPIAPNILNRAFTATRPGQIWVSDIT
jgi:putative transposase